MSDARERAAFFATLRKAERERMERYYTDVEEKKRWMMKCATGGGMRGHNRRGSVTLPKLQSMGGE